MLKVNLGKTNLSVSKAGMGVLPIGPGQLALPLEEGAEIICHAVRSGINFIGTAQYYRNDGIIRPGKHPQGGRQSYHLLKIFSP